MPLNLTEKTAGRVFRDDQAALLLSSHETSPPTYEAPHFLGIYRHKCPKRNNVSTEIHLNEVYVACPEYVVLKDGKVEEATDAHLDLPFGEIQGVLGAGRVAFVYKEGKCGRCGQTARSKFGKIVDGLERPPLNGRVSRS